MGRSKPIQIVIFTLLFLCACSGSSSGPHSWMDYPPEKKTFPLEPLTLMSHASDIDGVTSIEFFVDGEQQISVATSGNRLEWKQWEWNPPGAGTYLVGARGTDSTGAVGSIATSLVTITDEFAYIPEEEEDPIQEAEAPAEELPEAAAPELVTPVVVAKLDSNCREGPGTAFDIYGTLFEAEEAEITGRLSDNFWLRVALADRSSDCWISSSVVDISGELAEVAVIAAPPPPAPPPEAPPADDDADDDSDDDAADDDSDDDDADSGGGGGDTTPPGIWGVGASKDPITVGVDKVDINVVTIDDSGIKKVTAYLSINNIELTGLVTFSPIPNVDNAYTAQIGPFVKFGELTINGTVVDNAGNKASFSHTVQVE